MQNIRFAANDIRIECEEFVKEFDLIFCSQTIYYVAPEIDAVIRNISTYLAPGGIFCYCYNSVEDAFTERWLTYEKLRGKVLESGFKEKVFVEINRFSHEKYAIGVFEFS